MAINLKLFNTLVGQGEWTQVEAIKDSLSLGLAQVKLIARTIGPVNLGNVKAITAIDKVTAIAVIPDETVIAVLQVGGVSPALTDDNVITGPGKEGIVCRTA